MKNVNLCNEKKKEGTKEEEKKTAKHELLMQNYKFGALSRKYV